MSTQNKTQSVKVSVKKENPKKVVFVAEPLEKGFGHTLGNAMRRVLLSSIRGAAVIGFYSEGVLHEFSTIDGVIEDVVNILINLKNMAITMDTEERKKLLIDTDKEGVITAKDIKETPGVKIVDPNHYICTLQKGKRLQMELTVERGVGYTPSEQLEEHGDSVVGYIPVDGLFSPIKRVAYHVDPSRSGDVIDYEKLTMEVDTDGSLTAEDAMTLGAQILQENLQIFVFSKIPMIQPKQKAEEKKPSIMKDLCRKIDDLELSVRAANCLRSAEIKYVGDLICKTEQNILSRPNFGKKSLEEIKKVLARYGLTMDMNIPDWPPKNLKEMEGKSGDRLYEA